MFENRHPGEEVYTKVRRAEPDKSPFLPNIPEGYSGDLGGWEF